MLQAAQRVGDFEIVRLLGRGGMGEVYEAQQLNPPRRVALKVLAPWLAANEDALRRFEREAEVGAQLDHPGIVRIIVTGRTDDGVAYYTMHLVRGISLARLIRICADPLPSTTALPGTPSEPCRETPGGGPLQRAVLEASPGEPPAAALEEYRKDRFRFVVRVGLLAARALAHAHRQGFLHRDVKPSNLMIDHEGHLYLLDFGLTRALDPGGESSSPGAVRGTPWYMSPEQARAEPIDHRSDLYSLGVTLYELATCGVGPFTASRDDSAAVLSQVKASMYLPLRTLAPEIPRELERIILRCIQRRVSQRYQSADELAADLEAFLQHALTGSVRTASAWARRRRWAWDSILLVAAPVLLAVLITVAVAVFRPKDTAQGPAGGGAPAESAAGAADRALKEFFQRERPSGVSTPLLRDDKLPVRFRKLTGAGRIETSVPGQLAIFSPLTVTNLPTLIALDWPTEPAFEFSIDLRQLATGKPDQNEMGVFFGWHEPDDELAHGRRYFVSARLNERPGPNYPNGWVRLEAARVLDGPPETVNDFHGLRVDPLFLSLQKLPSQYDWHHVIIRVVHDHVTVIADGQTAPFEVPQLKRTDPVLQNARLETRGALGVWVRNGLGCFNNASIQPLPASTED